MDKLSLSYRLRALRNYNLKVMPSAIKQLGKIAEYMPRTLGDQKSKKEKSPLCNMNDLKCSCMLISYDNKHLEDCLEFLVPLHVLRHSIDILQESRGLTDTGDVQKLYQPLFSAVDPQSTSYADSEYYKNNEITGVLKKLSEACRNKLYSLPEYKTATGKMKKYVHQYVEFQSCRFQPFKTRRSHMQMWSDYYIHQFSDVFFWEFSAAADSLLGISAAYIAASETAISEDYAGMLDSSYMPWICSYQKMLQYYVTANEDIMTGCLNLSHYYRNLKQCEERLGFLGNKALAACTGLQDARMHEALVQALPVIYLSDPQAGFGLGNLVSRNLMKSCPQLSRIIWNWNRLMNSFR